MNNPMAQVYNYVIFRNKIGIPTILGQGAPPFRKHFERICATSIVERVRMFVCWSYRAVSNFKAGLYVRDTYSPYLFSREPSRFVARVI